MVSYSPALAAKLFLTKVIERAGFQCRIVHFNALTAFKKLRKLQSVMATSLHSKTQCFKSHAVHKCVHWSKTAANVSPYAVSQLCDISKLPEFLIFCQTLEFVIIPFEVSAVDYNAAYGISTAVYLL